MTTLYTEEQRSFAKAVVLATKPASAHELLSLLAADPNSEWPEAPTIAALRLWERDPTIVPATEIADAVSKELQLTVGAQLRTLLEPLRARALQAIKDKNSTPSNIDKLIKAYTMLVDKVLPKEQRGGMRFEAPVQLNLPGSHGSVVLPFGPKPVLEERVIEVEAS